MNQQVADLLSVMTEAEKAEVAALASINLRNASMPSVDVTNESTVLDDATCAKYVAAVQTQVSRDYFPLWGTDAKLTFMPKGGKPDPAHWLMVIGDTSDQVGALGYHSLSSASEPIGFVFAKTDLDNGALVSVTLSHEVLEMLADPDINLTAQLDQTRFVAYENADAVEDDSDGYDVNGVTVSDFVLPSYFTPGHPGPWDFNKLLKAGMPTLRPNGYLSIYVIGQGWTQVNAATTARMKAQAIPKVGSRRQRRAMPRLDWMQSTR